MVYIEKRMGDGELHGLRQLDVGAYKFDFSELKRKCLPV